MKATHSLAMIVAAPLIFVGQLHAQGNMSAQKPAAVRNLETRLFKQHKITDCGAAQSPIEWKGIAISDAENGLTISGYDQAGGKWQAVIPASTVMSCEVWSATLAKGQPDDILVLNRDQNEYESQLTILRFNSAGQPMPWQAYGNFDATDKGIAQVVQGGTAGNANIIVPQREGDRHSGYAYVYHLVAVNPASMHKELGTEYATQWPIITGNRKLLSGTETRDTLSEHIGNSASAMNAQAMDAVFLKSVIPPGQGPNGLGAVVLSNGKSIAFPSILVIDSTLGDRSIYFAGDVPDQLEMMKKTKYSIRLEGTTCVEEECRPLLLIAKQQN